MKTDNSLRAGRGGSLPPGKPAPVSEPSRQAPASASGARTSHGDCPAPGPLSVIQLNPRCGCWDQGQCPFQNGTWCEIPWCAVYDDEVKLPCSVTAHEKKLRTLVCCVTGQKPVTLHHCRGGSMATTLFGTPGVGQKQNDALQIPLHRELHTGRFGIDARVGGGVLSWEQQWGLQTQHLVSTSRLLRYSVWTLAWLWASPLVRRRVERFLQQSRSRCHPQ